MKGKLLIGNKVNSSDISINEGQNNLQIVTEDAEHEKVLKSTAISSSGNSGNVSEFETDNIKILTKHKARKHASKRYKCGECNYNATRKTYLSQHRRVIHEGMRYFCEECDYKTGIKFELNEHKAIKHEGKRYKCEDCNYMPLGKTPYNGTREYFTKVSDTSVIDVMQNLQRR